MPRFVQSQSYPGMVTYLNEDGSPGFDMPEEAALSMGYSVEPPEVPAAVALDVPSPVPVMEPGDVAPIPGPAMPEPPAGLPVAPVAPGGPMPTPTFDQPVTAPPPPNPPIQPDAPSVSAEAGGPPSRLSPNDRRNRAYEDEKEAVGEEHSALAEQADIEARGMRDLAIQAERDALATNELGAHHRQVAQARVAKWKDDVQAYRAQKVDPANFWNTRTEAQHAAGIVSMVLGGFMEPVTGKNSAAAIIERAIDRDMQAQQMDMQRQGEALQMDRAANADLSAIEDADFERQYKFRAERRGAYRDLISAQMAGLNSRIAKAQGAKTIAGIDQAQAKDDAAAIDRDLEREQIRLQNQAQRLENQGRSLDNAKKKGALEDEGQQYTSQSVFQPTRDGRQVYLGELEGTTDPEAMAVRKRTADRYMLHDEGVALIEEAERVGVTVGGEMRVKYGSKSMSAEQRAFWGRWNQYAAKLTNYYSGASAAEGERENFKSNVMQRPEDWTTGSPVENWRRLNTFFRDEQEREGAAHGLPGTSRGMVSPEVPGAEAPRERATRQERDLHEGGSVAIEETQKDVDRFKAGPQPDGVRGYENAKKARSEAEGLRQKTQVKSIKEISDDARHGRIPMYAEQLDDPAERQKWADEDGVYAKPAMTQMQEFVAAEKQKPQPNEAAIALAESWMDEWEAKRRDDLAARSKKQGLKDKAKRLGIPVED